LIEYQNILDNIGRYITLDEADEQQFIHNQVDQGQEKATSRAANGHMQTSELCVSRHLA